MRNGSNYADAYFELNYIKGYTLDGVSLLSSSAMNYSLPSAATNVTASGTGSSSSPSAVSTAAPSGNATNSALWAQGLPPSGLLAIAVLVIMGLGAVF
ncbi:hypothetical protein HWV62_3839 [Athelia sp. TMB]|nr:hypothetical protein HWV62_3839 [Athelia sp. TMB]